VHIDYSCCAISFGLNQSISRGTGARGGNQEMGCIKGGLKTKLLLDAYGKPVKVQFTLGMVADYSQAIPLLKGLDIKVLLADKDYDTNAILEYTQEHGITAIPPKRNRKAQRDYDRDLYNFRNLVENAFLYLKRWRGIATRYAKNAAFFLLLFISAASRLLFLPRDDTI